VISNDDVGVVLVGLRDVALFQEVAKVVAERPTLTQEERAALEDYGAKMRAAGQLDGE
jgi:predicted aldo/keto reductase-like oxidoreductase